MSQNRMAPQGNTRRRSQAQFVPLLMRVVIILIAFCAVTTAGFTFYPEWIRLTDMKRDLAKQKAHLEEVQKIASEREQEVHLLQTDPGYLEMIARDRLDLMKNGETIFRLSSAKPRS